MTFFANSGVVIPSLEKETRDAGTRALNAASSLWKIFSILEGDNNQLVDQQLVKECAEDLQEASLVYKKIALQMSDKFVGELTPAELDLSALTLQSYRYSSYEYSPFFRLFFSEAISISALYNELSQRSETLSSSIKSLNTNHNSIDLAPQVFQMMKQWEVLAILGRVIAVLNRRQQELNPL